MGLRSFLHKITAPQPSGFAPSGDCKMIFVVNHGLKMGKGKIAAQVGHGAVLATMNAGEHKPRFLEKWLASGQKKVCVRGRDAEHLLDLQVLAESSGILTTLVRDAGHTQIPSGSLTVLALGPSADGDIDKITGELKLL
jgi:PTH2 family peptidyl-tRNA hydrolase